jgi:acyl-CoA thioesterase-1
MNLDWGFGRSAMRHATYALVTVAILAGNLMSVAAEVKVVALGASNTYGSGRGRTNGGVSPRQAYPAQLEALLRARGIDARVSNEGVPGDTTAGMLGRLNSAVPDGTAVVILQPGGNDARRGNGGSTARNIAEIRQQLAARHIPVIMLSSLGGIAPHDSRDPDGQHFDARGHAAIARWLAPKVESAVRHK